MFGRSCLPESTAFQCSRFRAFASRVPRIDITPSRTKAALSSQTTSSPPHAQEYSNSALGRMSTTTTPKRSSRQGPTIARALPTTPASASQLRREVIRQGQDGGSPRSRQAEVASSMYLRAENVRLPSSTVSSSSGVQTTHESRRSSRHAPEGDEEHKQQARDSNTVEAASPTNREEDGRTPSRRHSSQFEQEILKEMRERLAAVGLGGKSSLGMGR